MLRHDFRMCVCVILGLDNCEINRKKEYSQININLELTYLHVKFRPPHSQIIIYEGSNFLVCECK